MRRLLVLALTLVLVLIAPPLAVAQSTATLIADLVRVEGDQTLVAEGNVEVFYEDARLRARKITYDSASGRLLIEGPITLVQGDQIILLADQGELSADLREGILRSARLVLDQQLQLAANEIARIGGRYTVMSRVVASSCQVCPGRPVPLWEIRARRVVHDQEERQIYFTDAQFRVAGIPILYLPRLRMPDPTLDRATGFLAPRLRTTSQLGAGLQVPYFITLGPHRDVTVTPYLSALTRTLNLRYRQAFRSGGIEVEGAASRDAIQPGTTRGYVFGDGEFVLASGTRLALQIEAVSDDGYLLDYGTDSKDRLASGAALTDTSRDRDFSADVFWHRSLRDGDDNATLPSLVGDASFRRRLPNFALGGIAAYEFSLHGHRRTSAADGAGRDVSRASGRIDWRRNWVLPSGILVTGLAEARADFYAIAQDASYPGTVARLTPAAAVELRWPFLKREAGGATQVLEPILQLVWSPDSLPDVPNDDSVFVEFDEGNLFSLSRFAGHDRRERGLRANLGVSWTRIAPEGWSIGVTAGRVLRTDDLGQFGPGSGLAGISSDWLLATTVKSANGLTLTNRAVLDDDFGLSRDELRLGWDRRRMDLGASYVWMLADPPENRPLDTSELVFDAAWLLGERWTATADGRYDLIADRAARAGLGLQYRNECVALDLSLSHRFTSSTSVEPTTYFGLSVELSGFGTGADGRNYRRSCGG